MSGSLVPFRRARRTKPDITQRGQVMLASDKETVLRALFSADRCSLILEEIAAIASISFERAWYAVLELIELQFMAPAGIGAYELTSEGRETARRLIA